MDDHSPDHEHGDDHSFDEQPKPRELPADLPRSLDDRKAFSAYGNVETEYYDAWQGQSQFLTAPTIAHSNNFNLSLNEPDNFDPSEHDLAEHDSRLAHMLATQVRSNDDENDIEDTEENVVNDESLSDAEKRQMLQDFLFMAASNGDVGRIKRLVRGSPAVYIDVNAVDSEGTPPLVYASCFGHKDVVMSLLDAGAEVDKQDKNQWSALMWAMTNRHKDIAKIILDHGASTEIQS
ncbi:hypothetical protein KCU86_g14707, partial [Aureobasidium melanogenum]